MNHPFNPVIELLLVALTWTFLYAVALLARWRHRPLPPALGTAPAAVAQVRDTQPYRMDEAFAVGGADPARREEVEVSR